MFLLIIATILVIFGYVKNDHMFLCLGLAFAVFGYFCPTADKIMGGAHHEGSFELSTLTPGQQVVVGKQRYGKMADGKIIQCTNNDCSDGVLVSEYGERKNPPNEGKILEAQPLTKEHMDYYNKLGETPGYLGVYDSLYKRGDSAKHFIRGLVN